ncbi:translation elongation factor Ts [Candidatus Liberibacter africanus]|uniref:Elongation factor Ts n=1 Tax=Candidatus Liberibacter africanus PTSAPSY TaxID=1277257 RepID=A0A0G3I2K6_LIBAF|nr:translation elongation factor Ts [Candidatus Liberibacter africanus]AKK20119.1 elongation factor Ts [Candidatus Liberibacter africanus PTSAPSY]QTP63927.1 translation elongation factor Ts [Candidatus Liberibacter africanus]
MSKISAIAVKQLREKTGAGVMDCKNALLEAQGNSELASEILRAKGSVDAQKRAGKNPLEGLIGIAREGHEKAVIVEVNVETDSLARNAGFRDLVSQIATVALSTDGSVESVLAAPFDDSGTTVEDKIKNHISITGECIKLRRVSLLCVPGGVISSYVHPCPSENMGAIAVLVALRSSIENKEALSSVGEQIALHVALASPSVVSVQMLDSSVVASKRAGYMAEALDSGKSGNIVEKIVDGKMKGFFKECVLLDQDFVIEPSKTVSDFLKESEKSVGYPIEVVGMLHFVLSDKEKQ